MIVRTKKEIQEMIDACADVLATLPNRNIFGDSNADEAREVSSDIAKLRAALKGKLPKDEWDNVLGWLIGKTWSTLPDYLP